MSELYVRLKMTTQSHPIKSKDTKPIYQCRAKGVRGAAEEFEYGLKWITARRAFLKVFDHQLECGDWTIPYEEIKEAELFHTRSGIIPCFILKVKTEANTFQFGLSGNKFWKGELPFQATRTKGRLKFSLFSLAFRILLIGAVTWYIFFRNK